MKYEAEIKAVVGQYEEIIAKEIMSWDGESEPYTVHVERILRKNLKKLAKEVSKIVRDGTLRFYEAEKSGSPIPEDLASLPLFREVRDRHTYNPTPPPGSPPPVNGRSV